MVEKLAPSPLPARVTQDRPLAEWLWGSVDAYDGLAVPSTHADVVIPRFAKHLKAITKIDGWLCVVFEEPLVLDPAALGRALPLRKLSQGSFASFEVSGLQAPPMTSRTLHLVQNGRHLRFALTDGTAIDPLGFWDISGIDVSRAEPLKTKPHPPAVAPKAAIATQKIATITKEKSVFAEIKSDIDAMPEPRFRNWAGVGRSLARLFVIVLGLAVVLAAVSLIFTSGGPGLIRLLVMGIVVIAVIWLLAPRDTGTPGRPVKPVPRTAPPASARQPRGPGLFERMKGWLMWHSPLGDQLRRDLEKHIKDVSKMIAAGDVDRALKHALALGVKNAEDKQKQGGVPTRLPKPRGQLDFDFSGQDAPSASILSDVGFAGMRHEYITLAKDLAAKGDHRRAAFIYAELLHQIPDALDQLEAIPAFEDAAKLATARKQPAQVIARLWFLAGHKDIALACVKRASAFEFIANFAKDKDPAFAAFVRGHHIRALIAAGDLARAIKLSKNHPELEKLHHTVLLQGILAGLLEDTGVLITAIETLPWPIEALDPAFKSDTSDAIGKLAQDVQRIVFDDDKDTALRRHALLSGLSQRAKSPSSNVHPFWNMRAGHLADALIRAVIGLDVDRDTAPSITKLRDDARAFDLPVLHQDLRYVARQSSKKTSTSVGHVLPEAEPVAFLRWARAISVAARRTMLMSYDGEITLLAPTGERIWTDQLYQLCGMVPIGAGRLVFLIQGETTSRRVSVFDTLTLKLRLLGETELLTWHTEASAVSWAIQTKDVVGALDVTQLLNETPSFDLLWSMTQTTPLMVQSFHEAEQETHWITQRLDKNRLVEKWRLNHRMQNLQVTMLDPIHVANQAIYTTPHVWITGEAFVMLDQAAGQNLMNKRARLELRTYDYEQELQIAARNADFFAELDVSPRIMSATGNRACAFQSPTTGPSSITLWNSNGRNYATLRGRQIVSQSASEDGQHLLVLDDAGRVIRCDFRTKSADILPL